MKTFAVTLVLAALAGIDLVTASPAVRGLYVSRADAAVSTHNITWVGRIFPADTQHTTIVGDPKTIHDEILTLDPNFEKDFADEQSGTAGPPGAIQRDAADAPDPNVDCPTTGNATTWGSCQDAIKYLNMIGAGAATCTAPANGCNMSSATTRAALLSAMTKVIATDMAEIHDACPVQRNIWHGPPDVFMGTRKWPGQYETQVSFCDGP
ncbi:hypothetical protein QBC37DRAFT_373680 [Rhypophila decipiens]|uniref:Uncharacterized protein n=1 Tax=Rhypophila decipiens TaxID=261697 RepID=A0AAN6Y7N5_9PEZI|nr:hypothetical protein QBC37DRAFT_373680 [Rhypophila decipiens]